MAPFLFKGDIVPDHVDVHTQDVLPVVEQVYNALAENETEVKVGWTALLMLANILAAPDDTEFEAIQEGTTETSDFIAAYWDVDPVQGDS